MTEIKRGWMAAPLAIVFALTVAACGSDNNTTASSSSGNDKANISCVAAASVDGAGSTFVGTIVQQWVKDYQGACPGTTVNYKGGGSGAGVQQLTAGTVAFAGSDVPLTPAELAAAEQKYGTGKVVTLPWSAGGIALEYKLSGVSDLKLSDQTVAQIFAGKITKWNDPAIAVDNSGAKLPSSTIQVVKRSDGSGTTAAFASYMAAVAPSVWTFGTTKSAAFPVGQGEKGSDGVTAAVKQTEGSIGYAELSYAKANSLSVAKVKNASGAYVGPDDSGSVAAALASATVNADGSVKLDYATTNTHAYPITTVTYLIAPKIDPATPQSSLVQSFATYALNGGQSSAAGLGYAELPTSIKNPALTRVDGLGSSSTAVTATTAD